MVQHMIARNVCNMLRKDLLPVKTFTNNFGMPNTINTIQLPCLPEKAEILEKWDRKPKLEPQRDDWINNVLYNTTVL